MVKISNVATIAPLLRKKTKKALPTHVCMENGCYKSMYVYGDDEFIVIITQGF